jgi:hypothetical protein
MLGEIDADVAKFVVLDNFREAIISNLALHILEYPFDSAVVEPAFVLIVTMHAERHLGSDEKCRNTFGSSSI